MRALRKLVLGETWALPLGVLATLALALTLHEVAGDTAWWRHAGEFVLLEGLEVVLIVAALGAGPQGLAPAVAGAAVAVVFVIGLGAVLHRPLARLPESHLKYAVGVVLSAFGVFFLAEGLGVEWPGGDAALLYVAASLVAASQLQVATLAREAPA